MSWLRISISEDNSASRCGKNADGGVTVIVDPDDYEAVLTSLKDSGGVELSLRQNSVPVSSLPSRATM